MSAFADAHSGVSSHNLLLGTLVMRPVLFLVGIGALALAAAPALTQAPAPGPGPAPGPSPAPSNYMPSYGPPSGPGPFYVEDPRKQCFNGRFVAGSNRAGDRTVYVQTKPGGIFRLELNGSCDGLSAAQRLTVRSDGNDLICPGQSATLVLKTAAGPKRCKIGEVSHLTPTEVADLAATTQR
jgi:hypothetical protein